MHDKRLLEMVRVERPNPTYAAMLSEQLGAAYVNATGDLAADLLSNIAAEQRAKVVYEYLHRQIGDRYVREMIDFLLNREEAHNTLFRQALNKVQQSGSNRDWGVDQDARLYFNLSNPGNNSFSVSNPNGGGH